MHCTKYRKNSYEAWNYPLEYPSRASKYGIKESEGTMFNSIFNGFVQGQKYPGRGEVAEPKLSSYRKLKFIDQNE